MSALQRQVSVSAIYFLNGGAEALDEWRCSAELLDRTAQLCLAEVGLCGRQVIHSGARQALLQLMAGAAGALGMSSRQYWAALGQMVSAVFVQVCLAALGSVCACKCARMGDRQGPACGRYATRCSAYSLDFILVVAAWALRCLCEALQRLVSVQNRCSFHFIPFLGYYTRIHLCKHKNKKIMNNFIQN